MAKKVNKKPAKSESKSETKSGGKKELKKETTKVTTKVASKEASKLAKKETKEVAASKVEPQSDKNTSPKAEKPEKAAKVKKPKLTVEEKKANSDAKKAEKVAAQAAATNAEENRQWQEFKDKYDGEKVAQYSMKAAFQAQQAIQHKILGWGFILSNVNDRLEVLFESGKKILISNYQG